jgi:outer membrane protein OmpA-like peptidoglycan-associated protein
MALINHPWAGAAAGLSLLLLAQAANAQEPPDDQAIELQVFYPAVGSARFLTLAPATVLPNKQFQLGFSVNYMNGALEVFNVDAMDNLDNRTTVVDSIVSGQLGGAYGFGDRFQLGLVLPITFSMSGDGLNADTGMPLPGGLSVTGFGDLVVEFGWRFYDKDGLTLAAVPALTVPTSMALSGEGVESGAFLGDDLPGLRPRAALEWMSPSGKLTVGANLGFLFHKPRTLYSTSVGQQLTYGVAAALHATDRVDVVAELFGRNGFSADLDANPLEVDGAVRVGVTRTLDIIVGGGGGVLAGLGAPKLRVFAAVSWSPDYGDGDGDGVNNMKDRCPDQEEDKDGWRDSDGCPEADNDEDKRSDAEDKCPNEAEDRDGFDDDDGCPEADNDKDGLVDEKDRCPTDAEDKAPPNPTDGCPAGKRDSDDDGLSDALDKCINDAEDQDGIEDGDGCPETDGDRDGVADDADGCPMNAEDKDGTDDDDGCPELDNDLDGFPDASDQCPGQRETVNGVKDDDGCPDNGGQVLAKVEGTRIVLLDKLGFDGASPKRKAHPMLDQVALIMRGAPRVRSWRIVVAAEPQRSDEATRALSQQRADALKAYLVAKGVAADTIEAVGVVGRSATIAIVAATVEGAEPPADGTTSDEPAIETE